MKLDVTADLREVERMLGRMSAGAAKKAATRTLNEAARSVQTESVKLIAKDMGVKQGDVRKALKFAKATWSNLTSSVRATGRRIPLIDFKARQTRKGVSYTMRGQRKTLQQGFIATMRSGHKGVYKRTTKKRLPIVELKGPSIPRVFVQEAIATAQRNKAREVWDRRFAPNLAYYLSKE